VHTGSGRRIPPSALFSANYIDTLDFRGWTWGDKEGMIKRELASKFDPSKSTGVDKCGCRKEWKAGQVRVIDAIEIQ